MHDLSKDSVEALAFMRRIMREHREEYDAGRRPKWLFEIDDDKDGVTGCLCIILELVSAGLVRISGAIEMTPEPENYGEYLNSPEWKAKADACKERAGNRCQLCNKAGRLDAHHRTYERLRNELPEDLIALCRECHSKFHDKSPNGQT